MKNFSIKLLLTSLICITIVIGFWWLKGAYNTRYGIDYSVLIDVVLGFGITFGVLGLLWPDKLMENLCDKLCLKLKNKFNSRKTDKNETKEDSEQKHD